MRVTVETCDGQRKTVTSLTPRVNFLGRGLTICDIQEG